MCLFICDPMTRSVTVLCAVLLLLLLLLRAVLC
jgi:hypothetical protein